MRHSPLLLLALAAACAEPLGPENDEVFAPVLNVSDVSALSATYSAYAGNPAPGGEDRLLFDTRTSLQGMTSLQQALSVFDGGVAGRWNFTSNVDGQGTNALVLPWGNARGCDGDDWKLAVRTLPEPRPKHMYVQWKSWLGRTATGGGVGKLGAYDLVRSSCERAGADRLRILRDLPDDGAWGAVRLEWNGPEAGGQRAVREVRSDGDAPAVAHEIPENAFLPEQHRNQVITTTVYVRASSSEDATDGVISVWQNGELRVHRADLRLGAEAFDRIQLPETMRGQSTDMTEYLWDFVVWEPVEPAGGSELARVSDIEIYPGALTMPVQSTAQVSATVLDENGQALFDRSVHWHSRDSTIASISAAGLIVALTSGATWVVATVDGVSDSAQVTVEQLVAPEPTPSPEPAPAPTDPDTQGLLLGDDFSSYSGTSDLLSHTGPKTLYDEAISPELIALDQSVLYNGHATLRYDMPGGTRTTPSLVAYLPQTVESFWYRAKIRFSPGWSTTGEEGTGAEAYKIFGWGWRGYEDRGGFDYTNGRDYFLYWGVKPEGGTDVYPFVEGSGIREVFAGRTDTEWYDGRWYDLIIHWQKLSETSGRATVWLARDGEAPMLRGTISGTLAEGVIPSVDRVMLGMNFNRIRYPDQAQSLWYGEWQVIDGVVNPNPFGLQLP